MSSMAMDGSRVFFQTAFFQTLAITGSPALAAETITATLVIPQNIRADQRVYLFGWQAFTVGTSGTAITARIRQTNVAGTVVQSTGGVIAVATNLLAPTVIGSDAPGLQGTFTYVLTLQVTAGAAVSTVSAVALIALVV